MGKSPNSCFKIITCRADPADVDDDLSPPEVSNLYRSHFVPKLGFYASFVACISLHRLIVEFLVCCLKFECLYLLFPSSDACCLLGQLEMYRH